jgi:hypothetical protein
MQTIKIRQHTGADGILRLEIPTEIQEGDLEVTVTYQKIETEEVDEKGWPIGLFDLTYGICADDSIVVDDGGISEELDGDMEGVFVKEFSSIFEQAILEEIQSLSPEKQQKVLDFTESLIQEQNPASDESSLTDFYGCIQDETFIRHPQGSQPEREPIV